MVVVPMSYDLSGRRDSRSVGRPSVPSILGSATIGPMAKQQKYQCQTFHPPSRNARMVLPNPWTSGRGGGALPIRCLQGPR